MPSTAVPQEGARPAPRTGNARGGVNGKSSALLMAALQFVSVPGYSALLMRRTFADLRLPGALIDMSREWLAGTPAVWNSQEHRWRFPGGASLQFGYCESEPDVYRYQGSAYNFIGIDEAGQLSEAQLRYLFSRLRTTTDVPVFTRYRLASNPGGTSHEYLKRRYLTEPQGRVFVPAKLDDNPFLDRADYVRALSELDPITRRNCSGATGTPSPAGAFTAPGSAPSACSASSRSQEPGVRSQ